MATVIGSMAMAAMARRRVAIMVVRAVGGGGGGRAPRRGHVGIVLGFSAVGVVISANYLHRNHFSIGPIEKLWH